MLILLVVTGLLVGIISTLFGIGGGIIAVPIMYILFPELPPETVISSSLGMIVINSTANLIKFHRRKIHPNLKLILPVGVFVVIGALTGEHIVQLLPAHYIKTAFSIFVFIVGLKAILTRKFASDEENWSYIPKIKTYLKMLPPTFLGGVLSSSTGIGGGVVIVPTLIAFTKMPLRLVPAHSNGVVLMGTATGAISYMLWATKPHILSDPILSFFQVGALNWGFSILLFIGAFASSGFGITLSQKISPKVANPIFGALLLCLSIKIFMTA